MPPTCRRSSPDIEALPPSELARSISRLAPERQTALLTLLAPEDTANVIEDVSEAQAGELLAELPPDRAADIVEEMQRLRDLLSRPRMRSSRP